MKECDNIKIHISSNFIFLTGIHQVKVKFTLEQSTKAQRGSRGIALLFL
jgi:hypothetical protein